MTTSKPLVSVIVPTKNSAKTLEACLRSVRKQNYKQIETIVVDNYSKDRTVDIARAFGVKAYVKGPERGAQVNFGVQQAKGKYIYRVDSDFILDAEIVAEAVEACETMGYDGIAVHNTSDPTVSFWARVRKMERDCYRNDEVNIAARFLRKEVFDAAGGFDVNLIAGDDYDLQNRLIRKGCRIGRIKAQETHIGEPKNVMEILSKHYYYGKNIGRFVQKSPQEAMNQLTPVRRSVIACLSVSSREPLLILGFIVYQFLRYLAAGIGMFSAIFQKES